MKIRVARSSDERAVLESTRKEHLDEAERIYAEKRADKQKAQQTENMCVISVDMQKCLPPPCLKNSQSFYKRKLWTLNETIYDSTQTKGYAFMWNEADGARGANEVVSCIARFLREYMDAPLERVIIWSNNCPGQNRNVIVILAYWYIVHNHPHVQKNRT